MDNNINVRKRISELLNQLDTEELQVTLEKVKLRLKTQQEKRTEFQIGLLKSEYDELYYILQQKKKEASKDITTMLKQDTTYSDLEKLHSDIRKEAKKARKEIEELIIQIQKLNNYKSSIYHPDK